MRYKKKLLLFTLPFLGLLVSSSISSKYSTFNSLDIKDKEMIVLFKDGYSLNDFKNELNNKYSDEYIIKDTYKGLVNGALIDVNYSLVDVLSSLNSVSSVHENKVYFTSSIIDKENYDPTKVFNSPLENNSLERMNTPASSNKGEGRVIAILDSSFNLEHEAFKDLSNDIEIKLSESKINSLVSSLEANNQTDFYYNRKIPFYHDYGGTVSDPNNEIYHEDSDVFSLNSTHGMHVSSIASANGEFEGVAPNSQLAFMKVFGDSESGQYCLDSMVLSALNDCYTLGVDVINLSLGQDLNEFEEESASYVAIEKLADNGVTVAVAAGNSGKGNFSQSGAYMYDTLDTVEEGTLGTYVNAKGATGVASANLSDDDEVVAELSVEGNTVVGRDQLSARGDIDSDGVNDDPPNIIPFTTLIPEDELSVSYEYVLVPGVGSINNVDAETGENLGDDYKDIDVKGKIAVIKRGSNTFSEKILNAKNKGAVAVIIANQDGLGSLGYFDLSNSSPNELIPSYSISAEEYVILENATNKVVNITRSEISDFSTNGVTSDLRMKVEIASPGQNIAGAVLTDANGRRSNSSYQYMSGTSMATPNYAGASALILSEQDFNNEAEEKEYKASLKYRTMSTANILTQANGAVISPRKQGAGLIDISNAINSSLYLSGNSDDGAKVELKNNEDISNGIIDFDVTIHNEDKLSGKYEANLLVQVPETKYIEGEMSPEFKGVKFQTTNDVLLAEVPFEVELRGEEEEVVHIHYELDEEIKNELNDTFKNGTYIEGYVVFESSTLPKLSIPYLGFFGDYSKGDAVEDFTFERESGKIYQSDVLNNLADVTGINKPNANFNSLIGVTTGGLENVDISSILSNDSDPAIIYTPIISQFNEEDNKYHLYAGVKGSADTLYIQQYVNRSVLTNTITLTNSSGEVVLTDHMFSALMLEDENDYSLTKSIATPNLFNEGYIADRAYTIIPLKEEGSESNYEDGIYNLKFEYELASGYTQTKEYVLEINSVANPLVIDDASLSDEELVLYFDEKMSNVSFATRMGKEEILEDGRYKYTISLKDLSAFESLLDPYVYISSTTYSFIYGNISRDFKAILFAKEANIRSFLRLDESNYVKLENTTNVKITLTSLSGQLTKYSGGGDLVINLGEGYEESDSKAYTFPDEKELATSKNGSSIFIKEVPETFLLDRGEKVVTNNFNVSIELLSIIIAVGIIVILIVVIVPIVVTRSKKNKKEN